jgi:hypothetical protein
MKVFPNPSTGNITLALNNGKADKGQVIITDLAGMVITTRNVTGLQGGQNISINLNHLASGTYMVRLVTKEGVQAVPVVVTR